MTSLVSALRTASLLVLLLPIPVAVLGQAQAIPATERSIMPSLRAESMTPGEKTLATRLVYGLLSDSQFAYRPAVLDQALAHDVFKRYLEGLDSNKQFFLQSDIDRFSSVEQMLPETIRNGQMQPIMDVFERCKQLVNARAAYAQGLLHQPLDFTTHDRLLVNRENTPWETSSAQLDTLWRKIVVNDWLRLKLAGKQPDEIRKTLDKRYKNLAKNFNELISDDIFQLYLESYTNAVDPHTDYFNPRTAENFNQQMSLSLQGIGAQLQKQEEMVVIREIIPGGPAAIDGTLKSGDRIVGVGQGSNGPIEDVIGWRIDDVVALIRGKKKTQVRLEYIPVQTSVNGRHRIVTLTRQNVRLSEQAAKSQIITLPATKEQAGRTVGVIKLPEFYQDFESRRRNVTDYVSATHDVARILAQFKQSKVDAVLLDLRNNGGGSLDEAIEMTSLFIGAGPVVQVRESGGRVTVNRSQNSTIAWDGPLAVLVNRGSASASEIFAGAIQDYGRGLIIGETTFGKGTVQNIVNLDRWPAREKQHLGQLKLTIAQFFRVSGSSTQLKGVEPDTAFPASIDATEFGESTYKNALPWTKIAAVSHVKFADFAPLIPTLLTMHSARIAHDKEFQWWQEDVAQFRKEKADKSVSLNEKDRFAERAKDEQKQKTRQEIRRQLHMPLDPLANDVDDGLFTNERDISRDTAREKAAEKRPDPLLQESAAILKDATNLLSTDAGLAKHVLLHTTNPSEWTGP